MDFLKIKNFCSLKHIKKMKRSHRLGEKYWGILAYFGNIADSAPDHYSKANAEIK